MRRRMLPLFLVLGLFVFAVWESAWMIRLFADWDSSTDQQTATVSAAINWSQNNFKALDGTLGTPPDVIAVGINWSMEGPTADAYETWINNVNPTADRHIWWPDSSGTALLKEDLDGTNTPLNVVYAGINWAMEGPTSDAFELFLNAVNPTADRNIWFPDENGTVSLSGFKVGSFTRDTTIASGTQEVTGVGFQPSAVIFISVQDGVDELSVGVDDGTNSGCFMDTSGASAGTYSVDTNDSINDQEGSGVSYVGHITTLGSDGFTITWVKGGSPTGTLTIVYLAIR